MTDDLVKRLRSKNCCDATKCNCDEAADRIEQLEAALRFYAEYQPAFLHQDFRAVARAALGEKKDAD